MTKKVERLELEDAKDLTDAHVEEHYMKLVKFLVDSLYLEVVMLVVFF